MSADEDAKSEVSDPEASDLSTDSEVDWAEDVIANEGQHGNPDHEDVVGAPVAGHVPVVMDHEKRRVREPGRRRCVPESGCKKQCWKRDEKLEAKRAQMEQLRLDDYEAYVSTVQALVYTSQLDQDSDFLRNRDKDKANRDRFRYSLGSAIGLVCVTAFMYTLALSNNVFKRVKSAVACGGMARIVHKLTKKPGNRGLSAVFQSRQRDAFNWLAEVVRDHALVLPCRAGKEVTHALPPCLTLRELYRRYSESCHAVYGEEMPPLAWAQFRMLYRRNFKHVTLALRRTDLCDVCHAHTYIMNRVVDEEELLRRKQGLEAHLEKARVKRDLHNADVDKYCDARTCWAESTVVICFDFAQNVSVPHHSDQPGQIFFKTPFRLALFGIWTSCTNMLSTYFLPEDVQASVGKGHECVIGMLDHFLDTCVLTNPDDPTETKRPRCIKIWADNCVGQNKNKFLMQYLAWRVSSGHTDTQSVELHFMVPGHTTKFVCDRFFGVGKRQWLRSSAFTEAEARAVWCSASEWLAAVDGRLVTFRNWKSTFGHLRSIPGITKYSHFRFQREHPWEVDMSLDGLEWGVCNLVPGTKPIAQDELDRICVPFSALPVIPVVPLPIERRWYLYREVVLHYVPEACRDDPLWAQPEGEFVPYRTAAQKRIDELQSLVDQSDSDGSVTTGKLAARTGRKRKGKKVVAGSGGRGRGRGRPRKVSDRQTGHRSGRGHKLGSRVGRMISDEEDAATTPSESDDGLATSSPVHSRRASARNSSQKRMRFYEESDLEDCDDSSDGSNVSFGQHGTVSQRGRHRTPKYPDSHVV